MFKHNKKGFTLIELIVVMAVIGILVLLAIPKFTGHTKKAKHSQLIANAKQLETASERYYMDYQKWPRLTDEPYNSDEIKEFAQKIYDATGKIVELDTEGDYYDIDYDVLSKYISVPDDKELYIIQNPVGNVYVLDSLTEKAKTRFSSNKPKAIITMSPDTNLTTLTNITWSYDNSVAKNGATITKAEWEGKQDTYTSGGSYVVRLRVQDSNGVWSDWVSKSFDVQGNIPDGTIPAGYSNDVIPKMTSNDSPEGTAFSNSLTGRGNGPRSHPYLAFDDTHYPDKLFFSSGFETNAGGTPSIIGFDFNTPRKINGYTITVNNHNSSDWARNWTFEAWDGDKWVVLDTRINITNWTPFKKKAFVFENDNYYSKYQLKVTQTVGGGWTSIDELEMLEKIN